MPDGQTRLDERLRHRKATRARRKEAKETARVEEQHLRVDAPPASEEELRVRWERTTARQQHSIERERVKEVMRTPWSVESAGLRVAIDLGMQHLMVPRELTSLATQVTASYSQVLNRCAAKPGWLPLRLALTGLAGAVDTLERIEKSAGRIESWPVHLIDDDFCAALPELCAPAVPTIVVLSPDAEQPLLNIDPASIYVIGGLCDYKRIANATRGRAADRNISCRRLPMREALHARLAVEILTVDQVTVALLEAANNGCDWAQALQCAVPARKLRASGIATLKQDSGIAIPQAVNADVSSHGEEL